MISVRSPSWSSSSGVGGSGRLGGPPALCGGVELFADDDGWPVLFAACVETSSERALRPGLYENSGLTKRNKKKRKPTERNETKQKNNNVGESERNTIRK